MSALLDRQTWHTSPARTRMRAVRRKLRRRLVLVGTSLAVLLVVLLGCNILLGSFTVTIPDFFAILFGKDIPGASFIVMDNKLPRSVLGALAGAAFGVSGAIFQTLLRNPLASPDIIGISQGASACAVTAIILFGAGGVVVAAVAIVGALAIAGTVAALAYRRGQPAGNRLILMGLGVSAMMTAVVSFVMQRADFNAARDANLWLTGSLNAATWERISAVAVGLVILLPIVALAAKRLSAMQLGDELAAGLGVNVGRTRLLLVLVGVVLAALATAAAGPIAFVAFLSGPIARRLLGGRASLIAAGLVGAVITLAADYIGAYLLGDVVMPVGVITGAAGAPFLIYLLVASNRRGNAA